jgi:hypothetical protein
MKSVEDLLALLMSFCDKPPKRDSRDVQRQMPMDR